MLSSVALYQYFSDHSILNFVFANSKDSKSIQWDSHKFANRFLRVETLFHWLMKHHLSLMMNLYIGTANQFQKMGNYFHKPTKDWERDGKGVNDFIITTQYSFENLLLSSAVRFDFIAKFRQLLIYGFINNTREKATNCFISKL